MSTLALPAIPRRIECFDISTIQGSETVASMVVCEDGKMRKSDYRKYRISPANHAGSDDFAAMNEVVTRRYRKLLEQGGPFPDLVLIDGGKGQLSAAYDALQQLGLANLVAVGIAKKEELICTRAIAKSRSCSKRTIRRCGSCSRFATKRTGSPSPFIERPARCATCAPSSTACRESGRARRKALLVAFGSLAGVRRASREELTRVVGAKTADAVLGYFAGRAVSGYTLIPLRRTSTFQSRHRPPRFDFFAERSRGGARMVGQPCLAMTPRSGSAVSR